MNIKKHQRWMTTVKEEVAVVYVTNKSCVLQFLNDSLSITRKDYVLENYTLVYDPDLGDMVGWRLVTAEERKYPKPDCAQRQFPHKGWSDTVKGGPWFPDYPYRIPDDYVFQAEPEWAFEKNWETISIYKNGVHQNTITSEICDAIVKHGLEAGK